MRRWLDENVLPTSADWVLPCDLSAARILAPYRVPEHTPSDDALIAAVAESADLVVVRRNTPDTSTPRRPAPQSVGDHGVQRRPILRALAVAGGQWRAGIEVAAMDGFTGFKTAAAKEVPDAVAVMDSFDVARLAGDALDPCRRRVQQQAHLPT